MLVEFDSIEAFARAAKEVVKRPAHSANEWTGNISFDQAVNLAIKGDESYVKQATELIDKLDVDMPETRIYETIRSPFGGRVNMTDWLTGAPTPMRRRRRTTSEFAPVKIVVSTTCSSEIKSETMQKRGAVILALLFKLQQVRPIQLYLLTELHGERDGWHYQLIRVESQPLAISVAAFALCNVGFARHLTYDYARSIDGFDGSWPKGYYQSNYAQRRAERLNLTDSDLVIKEAYSGDKLVTKPVEWIKEQLSKYTNVND